MIEPSNLAPGVSNSMIPGDTSADRALQDEHARTSYEMFRQEIKNRYGHFALHDDLLYSEYQCSGRTCDEFVEWLALDDMANVYLWAEV